jgi:hypothetical protein
MNTFPHKTVTPIEVLNSCGRALTLQIMQCLKSARSFSLILSRDDHLSETNTFQATINFKKSLQSDTKKIIEHNISQPEGKVGRKRLQGQFPRSLDEELIDKEQSY